LRKKEEVKIQSERILSQSILCKTLSGVACPLLTITENVSSYLKYSEELKIQQLLPPVLKKQLKQKYQKVRKLIKQCQESKGKVQKLLYAAFQEEIKCFYEYNEEAFLTVDASFKNFGDRLTQYIKDHASKKAVVITSRVHPGESQASFMLDGSLSFLLSDSELAQELRRHFVFKIVPMLNCDGVIYGNYRCSLLGCDLNRKWLSPNKFLHPPVYFSKQLIKHVHQERKCVLFCDMHGHSRKQNAFFYGCTYKNFEYEGRIKNAQLRVIPLLCCHKNPTFAFNECRFRIEKMKESTARVVIFREFNIMNSFTLECSFFGKEVAVPRPAGFGPDDGEVETKLVHLSMEDKIELGSQMVQVLENYLPSEQSKLNILSGKVLDIFYEEFIKFVPAWILRREEERK